MWGLKELPLPEPVSMVPATAGWLVVAAGVVALLGALGWWRWRVWQRKRYRREALRRLDAIEAERNAFRDLPLVLRMTALAAFPRDEVASLTGEAWVSWLNRNGGRFDPNVAGLLDRLPYDPEAATEVSAQVAAALLGASRAWVEGHRARL